MTRDSEDSLDRELRAHLDELVRAHIARGASEEDARRLARIEFGSLPHLKDACRDVRRFAWLVDLWRDLRFAMRMLRRSPLFAVVAIATLALGLGANTAVFSLVHTVLVAHLPVRSPEALVALSRRNLEERSIARFPDLLFRQLEAEPGIFDGLLSRGGTERVTVGTDAGGEPAIGELVSGSYFEVLGVAPHVGRLLARSDDVTPGAHPVVVLSYRYWQRRYGGDPGVVGRTISLSAHPMTVVGVSPPGFDGLDPGQSVDVRVPFAMQAQLRRTPSPTLQRRTWELNIVGRLKQGVSVEQAEEVLSARLRQYLDAREPAPPDRQASRASERLDLVPAATGFGMTRRQFQTSLEVLLVITASVLLIACLNVATLLLARASARSREFAVRLALGAGSGRLTRQLLAEGLLLSICGGAVGAIAAYPGARLVITLMSGSGSRLNLDVAPNASVLLFHLGISAAAALLFALAPALTAPRHALIPGLKTAVGRGGKGSGRHLLLSAQVALSVVVLAGAALFLRTVHELRSTDPGFRADHLLVLALSPQNAGRSEDQALPFFRAVHERVGAVPGVANVTFSVRRAMSDASWRTPIVVESVNPPENALPPSRDVVGPGYFATLEIPLLAGRDFTAADGPTAPKVAIVNESFARFYFPGRDPLGARIGTGRPDFTIVGVAKDSKYADIRETTPRVWYTPYEQQPHTKYLNLYVRTAGEPARMTTAVRAAIASVDNSVALFDVRTQEAHITDLLATERMLAVLATFFGVTAAVLAALGQYGVLALLVTQTRREIGIRLALGAQRMAVVRMVTGEASLWVGAGIVAGVAAAAALSQYLAPLLYGVTPLDPLSLVGAGLAMALVAAAAAAVPARRATSVDPVAALRAD